MSAFQLTASRRGWPRKWYLIMSFSHFNSQPHEEADTVPPKTFLSVFHFNSQPHEEADWFTIPLLCLACISTHSLTKRLTQQVHWDITRSRISTHSLTKRLTTSARSLSIVKLSFQLTASRRGWQPLPEPSGKWFLYFNSQPHEEADISPPIPFKHNSYISTHSLTKRLTTRLNLHVRFLYISTHSLTKRLTLLLCP